MLVYICVCTYVYILCVVYVCIIFYQLYTFLQSAHKLKKLDTSFYLFIYFQFFMTGLLCVALAVLAQGL